MLGYYITYAHVMFRILLRFYYQRILKYALAKNSLQKMVCLRIAY